MAYNTLRGTVVAALLPAAYAAVISSLDAVPAGWSVVSHPSSQARDLASTSSDTHVFSIGLTLQNIDQLESRLLAVSTPGHASYGQHLSEDEVASVFGPSAAAVSAVTAWLENSSVVQHYAVQGAFVDVATTVAGADALFNASYQYYTHASAAATTKLRTLSYAVPDALAEHVAVVYPGNYFGKVQAQVPVPVPAPVAVASRTTRLNKRSNTTVDAACQTSITPACLKQIYNVGSYVPDAASGSRIGFASFLNQSALYSDTLQYETLNGIPAQNFSVTLLYNGTDNQDSATAHIGEANLDAQNIIGVAHPLPVQEYITGGSPPFVPNIDQPTAADNQNEPYVPFYRYLLTQPSSALPQVLSTSYGDEEDGVPFNYAVQTCNLIGLLGLRGLTILHSSGDLGVGAGCLAPDNKTVEFNAIFPATCPWVTSVGGTVGVTPEVAWEGSSGGFSRYFGQPSYQAGAVGGYIATEVTAETRTYYAPYTNWAGRGFPDVAAHSVDPNYQIVYRGKPGASGGTSAAAPVWAGLVGLLNDARLRQGKPVLGFLNPLLYAFGGQVLTDITAGQAIGCNGKNTQSGENEPAGSGIVPGAFWNATAGWDPVTGYGTPDFQKLLALVQLF